MEKSTPNLLRTPLFDLLAPQARMTPFAGWEMPLQFSGITAEHQAVRQKCGVFDVSHMGKFALHGRQLLHHLQMLVPSNLERIQPGQGKYTVLLNSQGGIIDDVIFYYQGEDDKQDQHGLMVVNAATKTRDKAWLQGHLESSPVRLQDISADRVLLAVQGPRSLEYLQPLLRVNLADLPAFGHTLIQWGNSPVFVARTGYTGEDGFEVMLDHALGQQLWQSLMAAGAVPCGLGCRDTLRLEAAMALYGQDIDEDVTPVEAGLDWLIQWDKGDFMGRSHLEKHPPRKRLVALELEGRNIARYGYRVISNGQAVGTITSGTLSPTLGKPIALAYVSPQLAQVGQVLQVEIRSRLYPAKVVQKPFYRSPQKPKTSKGSAPS